MPKDKSPEALKLKAEVAAAAEAAGAPKPGEGEAPKADDKGAAGAPPAAPVVKAEEKTPEQIAEEKRISEAAGLDSAIGAKKKELENLRLEKRTLSGQQSEPAKPKAPAVKAPEEGEETDEEEELDDDGNVIVKEAPKAPAAPAVDEDLKVAVEALTKKEADRQQKLEKGVIAAFSTNKEFPLINVDRDSNNANWNRMLKYLPANYDRSSAESIQDAMEAAYHAAFRKEIQAELIEKGKQQGLAEAVHVDAADMGGIVPGDKAPAKLELTEAELAQAKKMGVTPEQWAAQKKKMQES